MFGSESEILRELTDHGFRPAYRSSALTLLVHPEQPGLEARVGTTQVVIERDGREIYRTSHAGFDLQRLLAILASERDRELEVNRQVAFRGDGNRIGFLNVVKIGTTEQSL